MKQKTLAAIIAGLVVILALWIMARGCHRIAPTRPLPVVPVPITPVVIPPTPAISSTSVVSPEAAPPIPAKKPKHVSVPVAPVTPTPTASKQPFVAPEVKIFKELIPKDIEIVRVYYEQQLTGPDSRLPFDINGSGFTKEFESMIHVKSGHPQVAIADLKLITPNQIHGTLVVAKDAVTQVAFPQVLIGEKPVFQAPEPFAVIRPGEVLNLIFTEMGESGRSGKFRVFTNLTPEMFQQFRVDASTPLITMGVLSPNLPFVVDGSIDIGGAPGGSYAVRVFLKDKMLWSKADLIRVVRPNLGQSGLIQRAQVRDGYLRPGDEAMFSVQGSGFRPTDTNLLRASVPTLPPLASTFSFVSPGRLELRMALPTFAGIGTYGLTIKNSSETLVNMAEAFEVVPINWTRSLEVRPPLTAGATSTLTLVGRDLQPDFAAGLHVETDEQGLTVGPFSLQDDSHAIAEVRSTAAVAPGDYLLRITNKGKAVTPRLGSLIQVQADH